MVDFVGSASWMSLMFSLKTSVYICVLGRMEDIPVKMYSHLLATLKRTGKTRHQRVCVIWGELSILYNHSYTINQWPLPWWLITMTTIFPAYSSAEVTGWRHDKRVAGHFSFWCHPVSHHRPIVGIAGVISTVKRSLGFCVTFNITPVHSVSNENLCFQITNIYLWLPKHISCLPSSPERSKLWDLRTKLTQFSNNDKTHVITIAVQHTVTVLF